MLLAESRERSSQDGKSRGSLVDNESQKRIQENCSLHDSDRTVLLYDMFWFMPSFSVDYGLIYPVRFQKPT